MGGKRGEMNELNKCKSDRVSREDNKRVSSSDGELAGTKRKKEEERAHLGMKGYKEGEEEEREKSLLEDGRKGGGEEEWKEELRGKVRRTSEQMMKKCRRKEKSLQAPCRRS